MAKQKQLKRRTRKRPIAVTIIVVLAVGEILLRLYWVTRYILETRIWLTGLPRPLWSGASPTEAGLAFATAAFRLIWLLVAVAVLVGLLRMRRWSWVMLVFWVSVSLSIGILHFFYRSLSAFALSDYLVLAADMLLVFALNQSDVQRIYAIRRNDVEPIG